MKKTTACCKKRTATQNMPAAFMHNSSGIQSAFIFCTYYIGICLPLSNFSYHRAHVPLPLFPQKS